MYFLSVLWVLHDQTITLVYLVKSKYSEVSHVVSFPDLVALKATQDAMELNRETETKKKHLGEERRNKKYQGGDERQKEVRNK
jgi:hypothetical protein